MLAHGLLILCIKLGELRPDDLAHAHLCQLFRHKLFIEQPALDRCLVLNKGGDHLVQILLANALGLFAIRLCQPLDLDLKLSAFLVETDILLRGVISTFAIVKAFNRPALGALRCEVETRGKHLLHEQAGSDRLQRIVNRLGDGGFCCIRLGNQVGETGAALAFGVTGRATNNLNDLR